MSERELCVSRSDEELALGSAGESLGLSSDNRSWRRRYDRLLRVALRPRERAGERAFEGDLAEAAREEGYALVSDGVDHVLRWTDGPGGGPRQLREHTFRFVGEDLAALACCGNGGYLSLRDLELRANDRVDGRDVRRELLALPCLAGRHVPVLGRDLPVLVLALRSFRPLGLDSAVRAGLQDRGIGGRPLRRATDPRFPTERVDGGPVVAHLLLDVTAYLLDVLVLRLVGGLDGR